MLLDWSRDVKGEKGGLSGSGQTKQEKVKESDETKKKDAITRTVVERRRRRGG